jgi:hypothetical protein
MSAEFYGIRYLYTLAKIERGLSGLGGFPLIDLDENPRRFGKSAQSAFYPTDG